LGSGRLGFSLLDIHNRDAGVPRTVVFLLGAFTPSAELTLSPVVEEGPGITIAYNAGAFAAGRLGFVWGPMGVKLASIDAIDGTGYTVFDPPSMDREWHRLAGFPGIFLGYRSDGNGLSIWSSDGETAPAHYLGGTDWGASSPLYLEPHIVWQKGESQTGFTTYDHWELWASPFSSDPNELVPAKVADLPHSGVATYVAAGSSYYAIGIDEQTVLLTHIPDGDQRVLRVPTTHRLKAPIVGIAKGKLYVLIRKLELSEPDLYRFAIDALPSYP